MIKSTAELLNNNKNGENIRCKYCSSLMLRKLYGEYIRAQFDLPVIQEKETHDIKDTSEIESVTDFWLVPDILTFENLGFSNTVNKFKYLVCADCERGPVGYQNVTTKESFIALQRVQYGDEAMHNNPKKES